MHSPLRSPVLLTLALALVSVQGFARFDNVSSVRLSNPQLNEDDCNYNSPAMLGIDVKSWTAIGWFQCPADSGNNGFLVASPNPLVASANLYCFFTVRSCGPIFGEAGGGGDSEGAYAAVTARERALDSIFGGCSTGDAVTFKSHTTAIHHTNQLCYVDPEMSWCQQQNFDPCDEISEEDFPNKQTNWETCECDTSNSPIILDLRDHSTGLHLPLTDAVTGVSFDLDRDGVPERIGWTATGAQVGFLVLDRNNDGAITDGGELFGNVTDQPAGSGKNGFLGAC